MNEISIIAEATSLRTRQGGSATANVWLVVDGNEFPAHRWNDFAVVVLGWWAQALLRLSRDPGPRETVRFMDGPYVVEVAMTPAGALQLRALEGSDGAVEVARGEGPVKPFVVALISQSREMLATCRQQGWWSRDADSLQSSLNTLEQSSW